VPSDGGEAPGALGPQEPELCDGRAPECFGIHHLKTHPIEFLNCSCSSLEGLREPLFRESEKDSLPPEAGSPAFWQMVDSGISSRSAICNVNNDIFKHCPHSMATKTSKKNRAAGRLDRNTRNMVNLTANPVWRAFASKPVSEETQTTIGLAGRKALYALTNGLGKFEDFNELAVTAHSAIVLADAGYGPDLMEDFNSALKTILMCRLRALQGEEYSFNGQDAQVVGVLLDLHEQQVQLAGKAELANAVVEGYSRANGAR